MIDCWSGLFGASLSREHDVNFWVIAQLRLHIFLEPLIPPCLCRLEAECGLQPKKSMVDQQGWRQYHLPGMCDCFRLCHSTPHVICTHHHSELVTARSTKKDDQPGALARSIFCCSARMIMMKYIREACAL